MRLVGYLGSLAATFLGLSAVTFVIGRFIPTDPVLAIVGDHASRETYERVRVEIGLDRTIPEQYALYLGRVLRGDFGNSVMTSIRTPTPTPSRATRTIPTMRRPSRSLGVTLGVFLGSRG